MFTIADMGSGNDFLSAEGNEIEDPLGKNLFAQLASEILGKGRELNPDDFKQDSMLGAQAQKIAKSKWKIDLRLDKVAWEFRKLVTSDKVGCPENTKQAFLDILSRLGNSFS